MTTITMLQFRKDAEAILAKLRKGEGFLLTYRGRPVARLEPITTAEISADDPFYSICDLATPQGESLTNQEIDRIVYES